MDMFRLFSSTVNATIAALRFLSLLFAFSVLVATGCWREVEYEPPKEPAAKETSPAQPATAEAPESPADSNTTTHEPAPPANAPSKQLTADELFGTDKSSANVAPQAESASAAEESPSPTADQSAVDHEQPRALFPWEEDAVTAPATEPTGAEADGASPAEQPATEPGETPRDPLPWELESAAETPHVGDRYATSPASEPPVEVTPLPKEAAAAPPPTGTVPPADEEPSTILPVETPSATDSTPAQPTEPAAGATPDALPVEEPVTTTPPPVEAPPAEVTPLLPDEEPAEAAKPAAIDPTNTRHNVWMLGSKWSLMIASEHAGAPADAQSQRLEESQALASALGVDLPKTPPNPASQPTAAFLESALPAGRELGVFIGAKHGVEETALLEVAIKSNLLLVLAEARPDLIPAVIRSVSAAAERAKLPPDLVEPFAKALSGSPTAEQVDQAVFEFHRAVDEHLRTTK